MTRRSLLKFFGLAPLMALLPSSRSRTVTVTVSMNGALRFTGYDVYTPSELPGVQVLDIRIVDTPIDEYPMPEVRR